MSEYHLDWRTMHERWTVRQLRMVIDAHSKRHGRQVETQRKHTEAAKRGLKLRPYGSLG